MEKITKWKVKGLKSEREKAIKIVIMKKKLKFYALALLFLTGVTLVSPVAFGQNKTLLADNGKVTFSSYAPLEVIKASSDKMRGAIDTAKNLFAFSVEVKTFKGFNGDLQREHFHENYLETDKFPTASFRGKFIEQVDFAVSGTYTVRAKGMLLMHGVQQERIIKGAITISPSGITIQAAFSVQLEDHNIRIPKIVNEKIAEEINVDILIAFKL